MAQKGRHTARKPATKFAHLRKKMEKGRGRGQTLNIQFSGSRPRSVHRGLGIEAWTPRPRCDARLKLYF